MNNNEKELICTFVVLLKSKFFFCNNYDDTYYQFTNTQMDKFVEEFFQTENFSKLLRKEG